MHEITIKTTIPAEVLQAVVNELERAERKHPIWPKDWIHRAAIVNEESGELTRAALLYQFESGDFKEIAIEATHTAAAALRLLTKIHHDQSELR